MIIFQTEALWKCVELKKHQCDFAIWTGYIVGSKAILEFEFDLDYQQECFFVEFKVGDTC